MICKLLSGTEFHWRQKSAKIREMGDTKTANELDADGRCIICGKKATKRRRGLCVADYNKFVRTLAQVPAGHKEKFESKLVAEGKLLPSKRGSRHTENPFEDALREFLAETYQETADARSPEAAESLAEELVADAEELQEETRAKRGTKKTARKKGAKSR